MLFESSLGYRVRSYVNKKTRERKRRKKEEEEEKEKEEEEKGEEQRSKWRRKPKSRYLFG